MLHIDLIDCIEHYIEYSKSFWLKTDTLEREGFTGMMDAEKMRHTYDMALPINEEDGYNLENADEAEAGEEAHSCT